MTDIKPMEWLFFCAQKKGEQIHTSNSEQGKKEITIR